MVYETNTGKSYIMDSLPQNYPLEHKKNHQHLNKMCKKIGLKFVEGLNYINLPVQDNSWECGYFMNTNILLLIHILRKGINLERVESIIYPISLTKNSRIFLRKKVYETASKEFQYEEVKKILENKKVEEINAFEILLECIKEKKNPVILPYQIKMKSTNQGKNFFLFSFINFFVKTTQAI